MKKFFTTLFGDESGQDLVEWALMVGFVAVAAFAIMPGFAVELATWTGYGPLATSTARMAASVLAVLLLGVLIFRRKKQDNE